MDKNTDPRFNFLDANPALGVCWGQVKHVDVDDEAACRAAFGLPPRNDPKPEVPTVEQAAAFVATAAAFALFLSGQAPHVATGDQARAFRHLTHQAVAADQDEPSPIRLKPTDAELRHQDSVRRWRK